MVKIVKSIHFPELSFFLFLPCFMKKSSSTPQFSTVADIVRASTFGSESRRRRKKGGERKKARGVYASSIIR